MQTIYTPCGFLPDIDASVREQSFTAWLSPDLHQAAIDFQRNIGLQPLYIECDAQLRRRTIFRRGEKSGRIAAHSGRTAEQFAILDTRYAENGLHLLSLQISAKSLHSAVWLDQDILEHGKQMLALLGLAPASGKSDA